LLKYKKRNGIRPKKNGWGHFMFVLDTELLLTLRALPIRPEAAEQLMRSSGGAVSSDLTPALLVTTPYLNEIGCTNRGQLLFWMDLLTEFGSDVLTLAILAHEVMKMGLVDPGALTAHLHEVKPAVLSAISNHFDLAPLLHLGRGQKTGKEIVTVTDQAARKLLGAICFCSDLGKVMEIITPFVEAALSQESKKTIDYKTFLQNVAFSKKLSHPEYEVLEATGPDHEREFRSRVKVGGWEGVGLGKSKKLSEQDAACQLLKKLKVPLETKLSPSSLSFAAIRGHRIPEYQAAAVQEAQVRLGFKFRDPKLLSIALVHPSHINEYPGRFPYSYRPLATLGSKVLPLIVNLPVLCSPGPWYERNGENHVRAAAMVLGERALGPLGKELGLLDLFSVGRGLIANLTDSIAAEVVQSCVGAMFLDAGASLKDTRLLESTIYSHIRELQDRAAGFEAMIEADPNTLLQEVAAATGMSVSYDLATVTGPQHMLQNVFEITLAAKGVAFRFRGQPAQNKGDAKFNAAKLPLRAIAGVAGGRTGVAGFLKSASGKSFIRFLLRRLLETLRSGPGAWKMLCQLRMYGTNSIAYGSHQEARRALESLFEVAAEVAPEDMEELQSLLKDRAVRPVPGVREHLRLVAGRIAALLDDFQLEQPKPLQHTAEFRDLLAVSALSARMLTMAPRVFAADELAFALRAVRGWNLLIADFDPGANVYCDLGQLLEVLAVITREAEASGATSLRLNLERRDLFSSFKLEGVGIAKMGEERTKLFNVLAAPASVWQTGEEIRIEYPLPVLSGNKEERLVEEALRAIFDTRSSLDPLVRPFASAAHDLKNLLLAVDGQVANAAQAPPRRYQYLAAAEQTLFTAHASARTLLLLFQTLALADYKPFVLSELLKQFVADLHRRVPAGITFQATQDSSIVMVLGDEYLLHAALENLCKNAIEALGTCGVLRIEWLYEPDSSSVLIEVADTGPGVPENVLSALAEEMPVPTTKPQGCGLGLLSVQHIAKIHGGKLTVHRGHPGSVFSLILPGRPIEESLGKQQVVETVDSREGGGDAN